MGWEDVMKYREGLSRDCLRPGPRMVLWALATHKNPKSGQCNPSSRVLSRETGLSERQVRKHLRTLEESKWIKTLRTPGRASQHELLFPSRPRLLKERLLAEKRSKTPR